MQLLLMQKENYPALLDHFFDGVPRDEIFSSGGLALDSLPQRIIIGAGLNPPEALPALARKDEVGFRKYVAALPQWFANHTSHVSEQDLYVPNPLFLPGVTRGDGWVLPLLFYRHGLVLDRLLDRVPSSHQRRVLEVGAGWGGFASLYLRLVSRKLFGSRYVIVDLPHSALIQADYLRSLGFTKLLLYHAGLGDLNALLRHADFDVLWMLPQHLSTVANDTFGCVFNFDSLVEMPKEVITHYLEEAGRVARGIYSVNVPYNNWAALQAGLERLAAPPARFMARSNSIQPHLHGFGDRLPWSMGLTDGSSRKIKYVEQVLIRSE